MKRKDKVKVTVEILETWEMTAEELLGLNEGEPVPPVGSDEWHEALMEVRQSALEDIKISVVYDNPAYDPFPGTTPLLPEHEPTKTKEWFLP